MTVTILNDDITKTDANAQSDASIFGLGSLFRLHNVLNLHCTLDGFRGTGKLGECSVPSKFENSTVVS